MKTAYVVLASLLFCNTGLSQSDLDGDAIPDADDPETKIVASASLIKEEYVVRSLVISNSSVLTVASDLAGFKAVRIVAESIAIEAGSRISADGTGYPAQEGPGSGANGGADCGGTASGSGAGHGGQGGLSFGAHPWGAQGGGPVYGSLTEPLDVGSGGGHAFHRCPGLWFEGGGAGGGAIRLEVADALTVDGSISANGQDGSLLVGVAANYGGGGSGGSIWITSGRIAGSGTISAVGGSSLAPLLAGHQSGGGGGGGRVAIYATTSTFTGAIIAHGGDVKKNDGQPDGTPGAGGTVYTKKDDEDGHLVIANGLNRDAVTEITGSFTFASITLDSGAKISGGSNVRTGSVAVPESVLLMNEGTLSADALVVRGNGSLVHNGGLLSARLAEIAGSLVLNQEMLAGDLVVRAGGLVTHSSADNGFRLTGTNVSIDTGGRIDVTGRGYPSAEGPGAGNDRPPVICTFAPGSGAGHGGEGGSANTPNAGFVAGGRIYGSKTQPVDLGSGGGQGTYRCTIGAPIGYFAGGAGGGVIRLTVADTLTVNGTLSADGEDGGTSSIFGEGWGAGGSGGSIWITTGTLDGNGRLSANGGNHAPEGGRSIAGGGGGAGGRIAIYYRTNNFSGNVSVHGGNGDTNEGGESGKVGSLVFQDCSQLVLVPDRGGDTGSTTVTIHGCGFQDGATAKLCRVTEGMSLCLDGQNVLVAQGGSTITATFDLRGQSRGLWDVVVVNPDAISATLKDGFSVEEGVYPRFRVNKVGTRPVPGRTISYFITAENTGNIDAQYCLMMEALTLGDYKSSEPIADDGILQASDKKVLVWFIDTLPPGQPLLFSYEVHLPATTPLENIILGPARLFSLYSYPPFTPFSPPLPYIPPPLGPTPPPRHDWLSPDWQTIFVDCGTEHHDCINDAIAEIIKTCFLEGPIEACIKFAHAVRHCLLVVDVTLNACTLKFLYCLYKKGIISWGGSSSGGSGASDGGSLCLPPKDPNEKLVVARRFIQPDQTLVYPIHFENIGGTEAIDVFVTDVLDSNLDPSTLEILTPGATYDAASRTLKWNLLGINLPPQEGDNVLLSIKPMPGLPSGTEIRNKAVIQFEVFETIETNEVVNIIDGTPPVSSMSALPSTTQATEFSVSWSGTDAVGEIEAYDVFFSVDGGDFQRFLGNTLETSAQFNGECGKIYRFYSKATDSAGNVEVQEPVAQAQTTVVCSRQRPGDCNQDGGVDVSDAICLLGFLFLGSPARLPCGDGSEDDPGSRDLVNWNGDAGVDLSDAIALLGWLFRDSPPHVFGMECRAIRGCPDSCKGP